MREWKFVVCWFMLDVESVALSCPSSHVSFIFPLELSMGFQASSWVEFGTWDSFRISNPGHQDSLPVLSWFSADIRIGARKLGLISSGWGNTWLLNCDNTPGFHSTYQRQGNRISFPGEAGKSNLISTWCKENTALLDMWWELSVPLKCGRVSRQTSGVL